MKSARNLFNYAFHIYLTIYRIILIQRDEEGNLFIQADGNPIIPVDQETCHFPPTMMPLSGLQAVVVQVRQSFQVMFSVT